MTRLAIRRPMLFAALPKGTTLTPGNLPAHLRVLRHRSVKITPRGDQEFRSCVANMVQIFSHVAVPGPVSPKPSDEI